MKYFEVFIILTGIVVSNGATSDGTYEKIRPFNSGTQLNSLGFGSGKLNGYQDETKDQGAFYGNFFNGGAQSQMVSTGSLSNPKRDFIPIYEDQQEYEQVNPFPPLTRPKPDPVYSTVQQYNEPYSNIGFSPMYSGMPQYFQPGSYFTPQRPVYNGRPTTMYYQQPNPMNYYFSGAHTQNPIGNYQTLSSSFGLNNMLNSYTPSVVGSGYFYNSQNNYPSYYSNKNPGVKYTNTGYNFNNQYSNFNRGYRNGKGFHFNTLNYRPPMKYTPNTYISNLYGGYRAGKFNNPSLGTANPYASSTYNSIPYSYSANNEFSKNTQFGSELAGIDFSNMESLGVKGDFQLVKSNKDKAYYLIGKPGSSLDQESLSSIMTEISKQFSSSFNAMNSTTNTTA